MLTADPTLEHAGQLACWYLIDGHRFATTPAERREWLLDHVQAARDPEVLATIREVELVLLADGDQRSAYCVARESLRSALVRHAVRDAILAGA